MVVISNQETQTLVTETHTVTVDIYCRSAAQDGNTLVAQEATCRQFAIDAGFSVGMVHAETASGSSLEQTQLAQLRSRYLSGAIQGVVVVTPDRLSRHAPDLLTLQEEMEAHHVTLHCVQETVARLHHSMLAENSAASLDK